MIIVIRTKIWRLIIGGHALLGSIVGSDYFVLLCITVHYYVLLRHYYCMRCYEVLCILFITIPPLMEGEETMYQFHYHPITKRRLGLEPKCVLCTISYPGTRYLVCTTVCMYYCMYVCMYVPYQ